jgi:hypothetical protein
MDVFTSFFCYAKKQKKGIVPFGRPTPAAEEADTQDKTLFEPIEESEDADLLPVMNIGFRA